MMVLLGRCVTVVLDNRQLLEMDPRPSLVDIIASIRHCANEGA